MQRVYKWKQQKIKKRLWIVETENDEEVEEEEEINGSPVK